MPNRDLEALDDAIIARHGGPDVKGRDVTPGMRRAMADEVVTAMLAEDAPEGLTFAKACRAIEKEAKTGEAKRLREAAKEKERLEKAETERKAKIAKLKADLAALEAAGAEGTEGGES